MPTAVGDQPQKPPARVLVAMMLCEMSRKLLDPTRQKSHLCPGGTRVIFMNLCFGYNSDLFGLRQHKNIVSRTFPRRKVLYDRIKYFHTTKTPSIEFL